MHGRLGDGDHPRDECPCSIAPGSGVSNMQLTEAGSKVFQHDGPLDMRWTMEHSPDRGGGPEEDAGELTRIFGVRIVGSPRAFEAESLSP